MKILKFLILFIGLTPLLFSCKTTKNLQDDQLKKPKSVKLLKKKLIQNQFSAEWLSAKAKVVFRDNVGVQRFTGYIRWKKDSVIWMTFNCITVLNRST